MNIPVKDKLEHPLSFKVMRLSRPALKTPVVVSTELTDLPGDLFNADLKQDPSADPDIPTLTCGQMMMVPESFGNIYLGETFSCYLFTNNESSECVQSVSLRADLQTVAQRITLANIEPDPSRQLSANDTIDIVLSHEVKDLGGHILMCEVGYVNPMDSSKRASFRKFYKFQVLKPLDVKTKIYNAESDEVFVEALIQNLTCEPINLERVSLHPIGFQATCMRASEEDLPGAGLVQPQGSRQYLYCLTPAATAVTTADSTLPAPPASPANAVGILDIAWRSSMGERARLQTCPLQRNIPEYPEIRMSITELPEIVKLEQPFSFSCKISNLSKRILNLILVMERQSEMGWVGVSGRALAPLPPGGAVPVQLCVMPLTRGLRQISGIKLKELALNREYDFDDLAQVFVT